MLINESKIITKFNELSNKINIKKYVPKNNFYKLFNCSKKEIGQFKELAKYKKENFIDSKMMNRKSVSDLMLDAEKSTLSLEIAVKIKNKIISAYQEIMNMQI
ncbi:flagellar hook-basal body complex protein FliE [Buchnera aphidicola (Chaitoregma tattakana)]|uniref:flagellar hook-basal body complex protein FliE n=1 Tax=Buchnera aphidicola TaxID=9 RepID=UPI0031B84E74